MSSSSKSSAANAPGFAEKTLGEEFGSIKVKKKEKEEKNENKKIKINVCIALLQLIKGVGGVEKAGEGEEQDLNAILSELNADFVVLHLLRSNFEKAKVE